MDTKIAATLAATTLATGLVFGCIGGFAIGNPPPTASNDTPAPAATHTIQTTSSPSPTPTRPAGDKTTKAAAPTIGDGVWQVGVDMPAGRWRTIVPADERNCYWARLKGFAGDLNDISANDNQGPGTAVVVTVKATDKGFESNGCGIWAKIG